MLSTPLSTRHHLSSWTLASVSSRVRDTSAAMQCTMIVAATNLNARNLKPQGHCEVLPGHFSYVPLGSCL